MTAEESIRQIAGLSCHNFKLICGGSLILYLGTPKPESGMTPWRIHIDSAWRLDASEGALLGSYDTLDCGESGEQPATERCLSLLRRMVGHRIVGLSCIPPVGDLVIEFDGGIVLRTFSHTTTNDAWELRHFSGQRAGVCNCTFREWLEAADGASAQSGKRE
jgi:hypothetical protein